jgi:hypothetical protein
MKEALAATIIIVVSLIAGLEGLAEMALWGVVGVAAYYTLVAASFLILTSGLLLGLAMEEIWNRVYSLFQKKRYTSSVREELLFPEEDKFVIESFLKEPSSGERNTIQKYLDRRSLRERREEAMLLQRLAA